MVNTALILGPESKSPLFATTCTADEFVTVGWTSITTFVGTIGGFLRQVVVLEQNCL
jgi:hypothetical protein